MEQNPAGFLQGRIDHGAELFRRSTYSWSSINPFNNTEGGVLMPPADALQVTATSPPSMAVNVAFGEALVPGTVQTETQKSYYVLNDAVKVMPIQPSSGSSFRRDWVMLVVEDAAYSGTNNQWEMQVIPGTTNGPPLSTSVPDNALLIGVVVVPAGSTTITQSNITDARYGVATRQGIYPTYSVNRPSSPTPGQTIFQRDTPSTWLAIWDGQEWTPAANFHLMSAVGMAGSGAGPAPAVPGDATVQYLVQAGSSVVSMNGAGGYAVNFPAAFPNGVFTVVVSDGDGFSGDIGFTSVISSQVSVSGFGGVYVHGPPNGGPYAATSGLVRINWQATGW